MTGVGPWDVNTACSIEILHSPLSEKNSRDLIARALADLYGNVICITTKLKGIYDKDFLIVVAEVKSLNKKPGFVWLLYVPLSP